MLIGYARVSKANGSQSLDLQRDALQAEGVDAVNVYPTGTNLSRLRSMGFSRTSSASRPATAGAAAGRGRGGRFSAGRKREVVMRLLRGEDLESVSRAVGITAARASHWRAQFLAAGQAGLKSRAPDARDEDHRRLQAKIGELLMETELLYAKVDQLEAGGPLARRRSTR